MADRVVIPLDVLKERRAALLAAQDAIDTSTDRFFEMIDDGPGYHAPARLRFPSRRTATVTLQQHAVADWQDTPTQLRWFAAKVIENFRKMDIPFYVHQADYQSVSFAHGVFGAALTPREWQLLHALADRVIKRGRLSVEPTETVSTFILPGQPVLAGLRQGKPVRLTPRGIISLYGSSF